MRKSEIPGFPRTKIDVKLLESSKAALKLSEEMKALYDSYAENAKQTDLWIHHAQALELLMVPEILDIVEDIKDEVRVAIFCSYQATRVALTEQLQKKYGKDKIGFIDGTQVGARGELERQTYVDRFQRNELIAIVANAQAGGETISLHDPTGKIERGALITPQESGRRLKQIFGRVDRAMGANSFQWLLYFANTPQQKTAERVEQRLNNIALLNDGDLSLSSI